MKIANGIGLRKYREYVLCAVHVYLYIELRILNRMHLIELIVCLRFMCLPYREQQTLHIALVTHEPLTRIIKA